MERNNNFDWSVHSTFSLSFGLCLPLLCQLVSYWMWHCSVRKCLNIVLPRYQCHAVDPGINVMPSTLLPSSLASPVGSRTCLMMLFSSECLEWRPALFRHLRPWRPFLSTCEPYKHLWGEQMSISRRRPINIRKVSNRPCYGILLVPCWCCSRQKNQFRKALSVIDVGCS